MRFNPKIHRRRSVRLKDYDYSRAGAYFVTICAKNRECLFGKIANGEMILNDFGKIVRDTWNDLPNHVSRVELDQFVVMPNHIHGIFVITAIHVGAIHESPLHESPLHESHESPLHMTIVQRRNMILPKLIGRFKMLSSKRLNELRQTHGFPVWQRNYHEHIIRDHDSIHRIREYIINNPKKWMDDAMNPILKKNQLVRERAEYEKTFSQI